MVYCFNPTDDEPVLLLDKHIGFDELEGQGIDGSLFQRELLELDALGKKRIQVWINSPGGVVMDGYNIYNAILKSKTKVDTFCIGIAASIAAVIFQAGRNRVMSDYSLLMYHDPYGTGDEGELEKLKTSIATMIAERSGKTVADVLNVMAQTTWLTADEALQSGFCDSVDESAEQNKKRMVTTPAGQPAAQAKAMWAQGSQILNTLLNTNQPDMIKVITKLGLDDTADEDNIVAGINALENRYRNEMDDLHQKCSDLETKMLKAKKEYDDLKAEYDELKNDAEQDRAKNMVEKFARQGRIKNLPSEINRWVNTATKVGYYETKAMLESLPVHLASSKMEIGAENRLSLTTVIASKMVELREKTK